MPISFCLIDSTDTILDTFEVPEHLLKCELGGILEPTIIRLECGQELQFERISQEPFKQQKKASGFPESKGTNDFINTSSIRIVGQDKILYDAVTKFNPGEGYQYTRRRNVDAVAIYLRQLEAQGILTKKEYYLALFCSGASEYILTSQGQVFVHQLEGKTTRQLLAETEERIKHEKSINLILDLHTKSKKDLAAYFLEEEIWRLEGNDTLVYPHGEFCSTASNILPRHLFIHNAERFDGQRNPRIPIKSIRVEELPDPLPPPQNRVLKQPGFIPSGGVRISVSAQSEVGMVDNFGTPSCFLPSSPAPRPAFAGSTSPGIATPALSHSPASSSISRSVSASSPASQSNASLFAGSSPSQATAKAEGMSSGASSAASSSTATSSHSSSASPDYPEQKEQHKMTFIGDSTIDNRIWVWPGIFLNYIREKLGTKRESSESRINRARRQEGYPELSVIEHFKFRNPYFTVCDYTNDGFTTRDCLYGAPKGKVFGRAFASLYPYENFEPLVAAEQDIKDSKEIILSIGGNDFREFLQVALEYEGAQRELYIRQNFNAVFHGHAGALPHEGRGLILNYLDIIKKIRELNTNARIILMTQYYPSVAQNSYKVYEFLQEVGRVLGLGVNPNNSMDVIHEVIIRTYKDVLVKIAEEKIENVEIVDVTSSIDPFDKNNHVKQIEPSNEGGRKIAEMLAYTIKQKAKPGTVYQFDSPFFLPQGGDGTNHVTTCTIQNWKPRHPNEVHGNARRPNFMKIARELDDYFFQGPNDQRVPIAINLETIKNDETLQKAIDAIYQFTFRQARKDMVVKIMQNVDLKNALAAAYEYYNSGRFGFFRTHGSHGRSETVRFIDVLVNHMDKNTATNENVKQAMMDWMKTSGSNNSSRAFYAVKSGLFGNAETRKKDYVTAKTTYERKVEVELAMRGILRQR